MFDFSRNLNKRNLPFGNQKAKAEEKKVCLHFFCITIIELNQ